MDTTDTPKPPARTLEETKAEIDKLKELRRATKDPERREDLGDAISALAMGAQFRQLEDERDD